MKENKIITSFVALSMMTAMASSALAAPQYGSDITLEVTGAPVTDVMNVIVPAELPIVMDSNGGITLPTDAKIENKASKKVKVTEVSVNKDSGWVIGDYADDYSAKDEGTKEIALQFRGDNVNTDGKLQLSEGNWGIDGNGELALNMGAKLPKQPVNNKDKVASVQFTIDWDTEGGGGELPEPPTPTDARITVDWDKSPMLPGSHNIATFKWQSNGAESKIVSIKSENPQIASIPDNVLERITKAEFSGDIPVEITANKRGMTRVVAELKTGEKAYADVNVYELAAGDTVTGNISGNTDGLKPGIDLGDGGYDFVIDIPVIGPDGGTTTLPIKPTFPDGTVLKPGDNNITVDTEVNGVTIHIDINIKVEVKNPSDGLTQTVEEAKAMGFTFSSFEDGLQIDSFENKQFKSEITVPENIGDFKVLKIGDEAFEGQSNIKKVNLPSTVKEIGWGAFKGCTGLKGIDLHEGMEIGGNAFYGCTGIDELVIPKNCKLSESSLNGMDPIRLELHSVISGDFEEGGRIDSLFRYSWSTPPTSKAITEEARIEEVVFGEGVTKIPGYIFHKTSLSYGADPHSYPNLRKVEICDGVTSVDSYAFYNCGNLTDLTIEGDARLELNNNAFGNCNISQIECNREFYSNAYENPFGGNPLESVILTNVKTDSTKFTGIKTLKNVELAGGVKYDAFKGCTNLETAKIGGNINESAFEGCSKLRSVEIKDGVDTIWIDAFAGCTSLSRLDVPSSVTKIGENAFRGVPHVYYNGTASSANNWGAIAFN